MLESHLHPLMLDTQYGSGLTAFLALYFKLKGEVSIKGLQLLLCSLTFIQYLLVYFIGTVLYHSHKMAFFTLLAILVFGFFTQGDGYYTAPSIGFLRFGFIYLILLSYILEKKWYSIKTGRIITGIITSFSILWSFESAIYTVPAVFFAEYRSGHFRRFFPIFIACFLGLTILYLSPLIIQGQWPLFSRYVEYPLLYANGLVQLPLSRSISFWWLYPILYGFIFIRIMSGNISNKLISALVVYGMALFTYYAGRAHPNNIFHISIPFILLSIYLILEFKSFSLIVKQILIAVTLIVFLSVKNEWVYEGEPAIKGMFSRNIPMSINALTSANLPIIKGGLTESSHTIHDCSYYLPLLPYVENNSIALLSDKNDILQLYACFSIHNALNINPYAEMIINPKAIQRMLSKVDFLPNQYLLIDTKLINNEQADSDMPGQLLNKIQPIAVGILQLQDISFTLFKLNKEMIL